MMLRKLTLTKPAIRMRRIWNFPIPISSTASDKVYVFSVVSEIKKKKVSNLTFKIVSQAFEEVMTCKIFTLTTNAKFLQVHKRRQRKEGRVTPWTSSK